MLVRAQFPDEPDFRSLLAHLSTRCSNLCEIDTPDGPMTFEQLTVADDLQTEALRLLDLAD